MWNPDVYLAFADQRGRPFFDLLSRVGAENPRRVVDLGCGPGNLTGQPCATLAGRGRSRRGTAHRRWSRPRESVASTRAVGDVRTWTPKPDTDVVVSNATLQWVPEHAELLVRWAGQLAAGSWIAMQVPGNFDAPSHQAVRDRGPPGAVRQTHCATMPFRDGKVVDTAGGYANLLTDAGCTVDAWETTYIHELTGEHPVLEWITGTALRPVHERLSDEAVAAVPAAAHPDARRGVPARDPTAGRSFRSGGYSLSLR